MVIRILLAVTSFVLIAFTDTRADVAKYVDEAGKTHFVDSVEKIPPQFRSQAESQNPLPAISRSNPGRKKLYEKEHYADSGTAAGGAKVEVFVTDWCPYCRELEKFLKDEKITYLRHNIEKSAKGRMMYEELGGGGIPIVRVGDKVLHGFDPDAVREAIKGSH